jgi:hypothetical protein
MRDVNWDFISLFVGGHEWWSFVGPLSLSRLVEACGSPSVSKNGSDTTYDYVFSNQPDAAHLKITITSVPTPRLVSIELATFERDTVADAVRPRGRKLLKYLEWSLDPVPVPIAGVYMEGSLNQGSSAVLVRRIERTEHVQVALGVDQLAQCQPQPGDTVIDESIGVQYVIGESEFVMADMTVKLDRPIEGILELSDLKELTGVAARFNSTNPE